MMRKKQRPAQSFPNACVLKSGEELPLDTMQRTNFAVEVVDLNTIQVLKHRWGKPGTYKLDAAGPSGPTPMLLWCPECGMRHVDAGEFFHKPHHTHACQGCGMVWRPAVIDTIGVRFLLGFAD